MRWYSSTSAEYFASIAAFQPIQLVVASVNAVHVLQTVSLTKHDGRARRARFYFAEPAALLSISD